MLVNNKNWFQLTEEVNSHKTRTSMSPYVQTVVTDIKVGVRCTISAYRMTVLIFFLLKPGDGQNDGNICDT